MSTTHEDDSAAFQDWQKEHNIRCLSHLKFAEVKPLASDGYAEEKGEKTAPTAYETQDPAQSQAETGVLRGGRVFVRQQRYDKLASDKPGEELAPDSAIWRMYAEEAKEHDRDLVERRNKNLDTMLLFAGLFSAILTAFLVESTGLLEPDLAEMSVALLLDIAQSQRRTGSGDQIDSLPPIGLPAFQPSTSARWINALWFMALVLSLGAAMMAMLAKEWLEEFVAAMPTHPHEYARERQSRLDALTSWNTLRIVDFLPTLLHFSLVLFTLGLIMHLSRLDQIIALMLAAASASLFIWYATVVILGAVREQCPYRTRVSKYLKKILAKLGSEDSSEPSEENVPITRSGKKLKKKRPEFEGTTLTDLRALEWLTSEARDPAVGDSAFQALAGLRTRALKLICETKPQKQVETTSEDNKTYHIVQLWTWLWKNLNLTEGRSRTEILPETSTVLEGNNTVLRMGAEIIGRLQTARINYPRELAFCRGTNVARYASALPEIYHYARQSVNQLQQRLAAKDKKSRDLVKHLGMVEYVKESAFEALDMIWSDDCPPFTADAYAELTAAELRLTWFVADETKSDQHSTNSGKEIEKVAPSSSPHASIRVLPESDSNTEEHGRQRWPIPWRSDKRSASETSKAPPTALSDLQARYSRALCRAAFQLAFHSNGRAPIGNYALINLLGAITDLGEKNTLDSKKYMITHYPQYHNDSPTTIYAFIPAGTGYRMLSPGDIGDEDGLLAGLTNILGSDSLKAVPKVETAVMKCIASIAPKLIKRWVELRHGLVQPNFTAQTDLDIYAPELSSNWAIFNYKTASDLQPSTRAHIVITYLIKIATFAMSFFDYTGICQLPDVSIKALYTGVKARSSAETWDTAYYTIAGECKLLKQWVGSIGRTGIQLPRGRVWTQQSKAYLLCLLAVRKQDGRSIILELLDSVKNDEDAQEILLTVLEAMAEVSGEVSETETLLEAILSNIRSEAMGGKYSECFTHIPDGFHALCGVGSGSKHTNYVSAITTDLIIFLAKQDSEWIEPDAVPAFFEAVLFVCKHPPPNRSAPLKRFLSLIATTLEGLIRDVSSITEDSLFVLSGQKVLDELIMASEVVNEPKTRKSFLRTRDTVGREERRRQETSRESSKVFATESPILKAEEIGNGEGGGNEGGGALISAIKNTEDAQSKEEVQSDEGPTEPTQGDFMPELMYHA